MTRNLANQPERLYQEKPTNCGTKAADVPDKFLTSKRGANPPNIIVLYSYCVHNVVRSWGLLGGWKIAAHNRRPTHDFSIPFNTKSAVFWLEIQCQIRAPHLDPAPRLAVRLDLAVEKVTNLNLVPTFLFDFYTYYRPIFHCLATIYNAADRQTDIQSDRNRPPLL